MKRLVLSIALLTLLLSFHTPNLAIAQQTTLPVQLAQHQESDEEHASEDAVTAPDTQHQGEEHGQEGHGEESLSAPAWTVIPFVLLLLMIATGPLFYEHFWHKNYPILAILLAVIVVAYYVFVLGNMGDPVHALFEYLQFIALLASLFIASGGILIKVDKKATPIINSSILLIGSAISNLIGTTGASMLLIRPFIRLYRFLI